MKGPEYNPKDPVGTDLVFLDDVAGFAEFREHGLRPFMVQNAVVPTPRGPVELDVRWALFLEDKYRDVVSYYLRLSQLTDSDVYNSTEDLQKFAQDVTYEYFNPPRF